MVSKKKIGKNGMEKQYAWSCHRNFIFILFFCIAFLMTGCDQSYEERQAKKELERKEQIRKHEERIKVIFDQITKKHNAIYFPPMELEESAFTYELQRFFLADAERAVLFKGYLEDVAKTERGFIVEFLCPLGENFYVNKIAIRFKLSAAEEKVKQFLSAKRGDPEPFYFSDPNYFVVAKITGLKRLRRYEFGGSAKGDEINIDVEIPPSFVSTGKLLDVISIPID